ncbi:MAG TPA: hypothetical protein VGL81_30005 [Polyangiaceae bacterium]|jgi:hypothetical protein
MYRFSAWFLPLAVLASCSSSSSKSAAPTGTQAVWIVPASLGDLSGVDFYDHPWPSDLRRNSDGTIHCNGFYNPHLTIILQQYIDTTCGTEYGPDIGQDGGVEVEADAGPPTPGVLKGFSPAAAGYLRFTGDIDQTTLPADPVSAATAGSSVQLIDVDPTSPEHGKRKLIETFFWPAPDGIYWVHDTLAVQPALGYPLRANTQYAIVVTNDVKAVDGSTITPSSDLAEVLDLAAVEPRVQAAHNLYAPAVADLAADGIPASSIVQLAVFTTNDPTSDLFAVADDVHANVPAPTADPTQWTAADQTTDYDVYEGVYGPSPNYQQGTPPYSNSGGNFVFDASGKPVMQNTFPQTFCLVVPNGTTCPMPASGYPIVLYAHGTGGDYRSIVDEEDSFGQLMAQQCLASIGINQLFAGNRPGSPGLGDPNYAGDQDLLFINLNNPTALRTNMQQGAVDFIQLARLFTESALTVPASLSRTQTAITFDGTKVIFIGHSEGGADGPLFLAADKQALGGVLSGSGAMVEVGMLYKTQPAPSVSQALMTLLQLITPDEQAELNLFHPVLNFAQMIGDATDPLNYAKYIIQSPRPGFPPKSILQTEGVNPDGTGDEDAPPLGIEIHSVALGLPREAPGVHTIVESPWGGGLADVTIPTGGLTGNLASGQASGVLGQFVPPAGDTGHFVAFDVPAAHAQVGGFCANLAVSPKGLVPPLQH